MKVTRRALARMVAGTAVLSGSAIAQAPPASDAELNAARAGFRDAARELGAVKLPRATEPATRFEV